MPKLPPFAVDDRVVERDPHYLLGPRVVVVGRVVEPHENSEDYWVTGLRVPDRDPRGRYDWDGPYLFGADELRPYRPRADKAYFLRACDLHLLRELAPVEPSNAAARTISPVAA